MTVATPVAVPDVVAALGRSRPDSWAVEAGGRRITYGELIRYADAVAHHLRGAIASGESDRDRVVGVCADRSIEYVVGCLGVLRGGLAYLPIDPSLPQARRDFLIADAAPVHVLDAAQIASVMAGPAGEPIEPAAADLAYVIYTSGSTGRPKGIAVEHGALSNLVAWHHRAFGTGPDDRIALMAGLGFDAAVWELWTSLTAGATVVIPPDGVRRDPRALRDFLIAERITATFVPTALAHELLGLEWPDRADLRLLHTGGEALTMRPRAGLPFVLVNQYGPTEATVIALSGSVPPGSGTPSIGRPIDGVTADIRDSSGVAVPDGEIGELWLGGAGLARGYLNQPGLTATAFPTDPAGHRFYRTGDLVRRRADGDLDYCGRIDDQIQVRGYRVEPGEVEAALTGHPAITAAAVRPGLDSTGNTCLHAWYAAAAPVDDLGGWLRERLPAYFVPARFAWLERLPVTVNGKVDRAALHLDEPARVARRMPEGPVQEMLAGIWTRVLGWEVGVDEPFDALGGHSLHAARIVNRIADESGVDIPIGLFFGPLTIVDLAERPEFDGPRSVSPELADTADAAPTAAQARYWFIEQYLGASSLYHVAAVFGIDGPLDVTALTAALEALHERHEALRLSIADTADGPRQQLSAYHGMDFTVVDRPESPTEVFRAAAARPFDLAMAPLVRFVLVRTGDQAWQLGLIGHHIAVDAAALDVIMRELALLYPAMLAGAAVPELRVPSWAAIARREADLLRGPKGAALADYWTDALAGAPALLDLPTDKVRPAEPSYRGSTVLHGLSPVLLQRVDALARSTGTSRFMVVLAALATVLHRYSGQDDVVVGTPVANRPRPEFEDMVGCFVNTIPMRCDLAGTPTFTELLARVRTTAVGAYEHQELPFDRLLEALQLNRPRTHHPVFTVMLAVQQPEVLSADLAAGTTLRFLGELHLDAARFDLTVALEPHGDGYALAVEYAEDLFGPETASRLARHVEQVLAGAVEQPDAELASLLTADVSETSQVLDWGTGPAPLADIDVPVYRVVERLGTQQPDKVAAICGAQRLTYGELDAEAARLSRALAAAGVRRGDMVGVCVPRGVSAVVSMLAVAKAGGVYLPLDAGYPDERLRVMLDDARPTVVVTPYAERLAALSDARFVSPGGTSKTDAVPDGAGADDPAYVIYTSGSTGRPKGVLATHRGLANLAAAKVELFDVRPDSRVLQFVSLGFGVSISDMAMTLTAGATLVMRGTEALSPAALVALVDAEQVTNLVLPASVLAAIPAGDGASTLPSVRAIAVGGEPCSAALVELWAPGRHFVNAYGPTEATVASAMAVCRPGGGPPPIGRPIPGARIYVLDDRNRPMPPGVPGELCVAGAGVTLGYLNDPARTAAAFPPDPFGPGRMYRTGDQARWRSDGQLVLLGRFDDQVNLRGVRIEFGDIEAALRTHPAVADAAAAIQDHPVAGQQLVAYLVGGGSDRPDTAALRRFLAERLPEYYVPAVVMWVDALPRTTTGKVNRRALPTVDADGGFGASRPPQGITEEVLAEIWQEVLAAHGRPADRAIGADDDFFAIGGQSILGAAVMTQIRARFEVRLPVRALFEASTVAGLAQRVEQAILAELAAEDTLAAEDEPAAGIVGAALDGRGRP